MPCIDGRDMSVTEFSTEFSTELRKANKQIAKLEALWCKMQPFDQDPDDEEFELTPTELVQVQQQAVGVIPTVQSDEVLDLLHAAQMLEKYMKNPHPELATWQSAVRDVRAKIATFTMPKET